MAVKEEDMWLEKPFQPSLKGFSVALSFFRIRSTLTVNGF